MAAQITPKLRDLLEGFPYTLSQFEQYIVPLVESILNKADEKTLIVGIQGGQGTGKTTLAKFLAKHLSALGKTAISFSIDDFYESHKFRRQLAQTHKNNPFYQIVRGMPGTHRVQQLHKALKRAKIGENFDIPVFDKQLQNNSGDITNSVRSVKEKQSVIILEGWCLGAASTTTEHFVEICRKNNLKLESFDPNLEHHRPMLKFLQEYQAIWEYIDHFIMLQAQTPSLHKEWRWKREKQDTWDQGIEGVSKEEIYAYVEKFLPITYLCYEKISPDVKLHLDRNQKFTTKTTQESAKDPVQ